ncbi:TonB-dependent receptor plug domain-containing protein [Caulobacter segnis]
MPALRARRPLAGAATHGPARRGPRGGDTAVPASGATVRSASRRSSSPPRSGKTNLQDSPDRHLGHGRRGPDRPVTSSVGRRRPGRRLDPVATRGPVLRPQIGPDDRHARHSRALGDANQPARDQAVGVYVNGVYLGRAQGLRLGVAADVERIEVLKGPQGTLFGRNTEGGAVSIVTKAPTGVFGMNTTLGYGNYNAYKRETYIDLAGVPRRQRQDRRSACKRGGTTTNPTTSGQPDFNSYDKRGVNLGSGLEGQRQLQRRLCLRRPVRRFDPYYVQPEKKGSPAPGAADPVQPDRAKTANIGVPLQMSEGDTWGHRLNLTWTLADDLDPKSISSYRKLT